MKRYIILLAAAALALFLSASCNRKYEYEPATYASLYLTSFAVDETVGEVKVPVIISNKSKSDVQIAVTLKPGTALSNTDYELISPANGILTFSGDTDSLAAVIGIKAFEGVFTGGKAFTLEISSLTDGVSVGNFSTAKLSIKDLDHPLNFLMGSWTGILSDIFSDSQIPVELTVSEDPDDPTYKNLVVEGLDPRNGSYSEAIIGTYNSDANELVFAAKQQLVSPPEGNAPGLLMGWDAAFTMCGKDLVMVYDETDNTLTTQNIYGGWVEGTGLTPKDAGFYSLYESGAVFTKK